VQLKQKSEKEMNSLSPLLLSAIGFYDFMSVSELPDKNWIYMTVQLKQKDSRVCAVPTAFNFLVI